MRGIQTVTLNPAVDLHYYMEHFEAEKENYVQSVLYGAGGKGINISRALTVNGVENTAYVILGDENGASFEDQLRRDGMNFVPFYTKGRVRENITLHPAKAKETRISLDTFSVEDAVLDDMEKRITQTARNGDLLAFAGRLSRGIEKERVISFLKHLVSKGIKLIVDSNSMTTEDLTKIHPWLIKPNEQEITTLLGKAVTDLQEAANAARELARRGVAEEVMISLGGDGAAWSNGERKIILNVPRLAHPVSTIGAGDSTLAGLLAATARGAEKADALCHAVSFGTAACMTEGTLPPLPEDVKTVLEQVRATEIK